MKIPRKYQRLALDHLDQRIQAGFRRLYVTLPTGTGKSLILALLASRRCEKGRVLVITNRQNLAIQLYDVLVEEGLDVGLLMEGSRDLNASVVVAALPSLSATLSPLLEASTIPIRTILIDEAHHAVPGSSYEDALLVIEAQDETESVVTVGFTATPYRSDSQSMLTLLPTCAFARDIPEMVQAGLLAPLTWVPMTFDVNLSAVPTTTNRAEESDYSQEELTDTFVRFPLTQAIVRQALPHLEQRPTLVFTLTVDHAKQFAAIFRQEGRSAAAISGRMSKAQKERLYADWRAGDIQIICNCALLTEGFDFPPLAALLIARPTRSPVLYVQMLGRGMRPAPGKRDCLVMDVIGNHPESTHQIVLPHIVGVSTSKEVALITGQQTPATVTASDQLLKQLVGTEVNTGLSLLDPIGQSSYRWSTYNSTYFTMVSSDVAAIIERDQTGSGLYHSRLYTMRQGEQPIHQWVERDNLPLRQQVALIQDATRTIFRKKRSGKDTSWRDEPVTEKQILTLWWVDAGLSRQAREEGWTKEMASEVITLNRRELLDTLRHPPSME